MSLFAHGDFSERADLPVPELVVLYGALLVLLVSFVALVALWPRPRLERGIWRPLPAGVGRALGSRTLEVACGAIGVFALGLVVYAGLRGSQTQSANIAPILVYVVLWNGFVLASVLLGDVFRAFNPWRAIGRATSWLAGAVTRRDLPEPLAYPERLGHWPAVGGLLAFTTLELVAADGRSPDSVAIATLVYSAATFVGMALYGVEPWMRRGEAFSVYFNLFSRLSLFETRERVVGVRRWLSGLPTLEPAAGTVAFVAVMIGSVTFDGAGEGDQWLDVSPDIALGLRDLGLSAQRAFELTYFGGLLFCVGAVLGLYWLGSLGARTAGGGFSTTRLARAFVHSLVPIALAYVAAHYMTQLLFDGQRLFYTASDPLGTGADLFGSAGYQVDFTVIGATATWYWQTAFVVIGHALGLALAHDRALVLYGEAKQATRSQLWMLLVMMTFTAIALYLLSQANS